MFYIHWGFWDTPYFPVIFSPLGAKIRENKAGVCVILLIDPLNVRLEGIGNEFKVSEKGLPQFSSFFPRSVTQTHQSKSGKYIILTSFKER